MPGSQYSNLTASVYLDYTTWLDSGDQPLFHEYGHAWSLYHAIIVQQDPEFSGYIKARGLQGDSRLNNGTTSWDVKEMIAEDYRQLFGTSNAASRTQANSDIPPAVQIAGLREYLSGDFMYKLALPSDTTVPSTPASLSAVLAATSTGASQVNLSWSASTDNVGVTSYDIYRNGTLLTTVNGTSYADTAVSTSTSYNYYVVARDAPGNKSGPSSSVSITIPAPAPTITGSVTSSTGAPLAGVKITTGKGGTIKTTSTNSSGSYTLTNLANGTYIVSYSLKGYSTVQASVTVSNGTVVKNVVLQKR